MIRTVLLVLLAAAAGCGERDPAEDVDHVAAPLAGNWRAVLTSPGGELPFTLSIIEDGGTLSAVARNGDEEVPFSSVERSGDRVTLHFDWYDSEITADLTGGSRMEGRWRRTSPAGAESVLPFAAAREDSRRFLPAESTEDAAPATVDGHWAVEFRDPDGSEPARAELAQVGDEVTGTFLTPTGDYRFLAGSFEYGLLRLSTFDGAHAFLFQARALDDGTLKGDFWSRDTYHATWTARPIDEDEDMLPDAWTLVGLTNDEGRFGFAFPDLEGQTSTSEDPRFDGKVLLVNVFGSWCPNCNDEAPLLAAWDRRYRDRGLEIVGLAYEFSGEPERDRTMVARFAARHGIDYPLLLAGTSDKQAAAETLPDLTAVIAYPTSIFIGRDGKVRKIHSGFSGPGTGSHYQRLVAELEGLIEELLAEAVPEV
ncbi:MAG: TlpA disulfide reductase family protein [Thermoanaerobaculia bacterium]